MSVTIPRVAQILLALALMAVVAACSGASASEAPVAGTPIATTSTGTQQLTVHGVDAMRFEPNAITVNAGQQVELTFQNDGSSDHDFSLSEGIAQPVKIVARGGQSGTATFTLDHPGTYNFTCSQFGHAGAGMNGTITAK